MKYIAIAALLLAIWNHDVAARTRCQRYAVTIGPAAEDSFTRTVTLRDNKLQRTLWTRKYEKPHVRWSRDRRAFTIDDFPGVTLWRQGRPLRRFAVPGGRDYMMGCLLSPDKRRILIRCGSSGATDLDAGSLYCLKVGLGTRYSYSLVSHGVRKMTWRGNRTVLYRCLDDETGNESKLLRWHAD